MEKMEKNKIGKGIILVMLMIFGINFVSALTYSSPSDVYNGFSWDDYKNYSISWGEYAGNLFYSGGNVLIGTATSIGSGILQVNGSAFIDGNIGIGTQPTHPLTVYGDNASTVAVFHGNISAKGFNVWSEVFNKDAVNSTNSANTYLGLDGEIIHERHPCFSGYENITDFSRLKMENRTEEVCEQTLTDGIEKDYTSECHNETIEVKTYPYTKVQPQINLVCWTAMNEQFNAQIKEAVTPTKLEDNTTALRGNIAIFGNYLTNTPKDNKTKKEKKIELDNILSKKDLRDKDGKLIEVPEIAITPTEKASWSISGMVDWIYELILGHESRLRILEDENEMMKISLCKLGETQWC